MNYTHHCCCNWDDCEAIQAKLHELLPEDHVYRKNLCNIEKSNSYKIMALRACIAHHFQFKDDEAKRENKIYCVAPHHFHEQLLKNYLQTSQPLDRATAQSINERLVIDKNQLKTSSAKKWLLS